MKSKCTILSLQDIFKENELSTKTSLAEHLTSIKNQFFDVFHEAALQKCYDKQVVEHKFFRRSKLS